MEVQNVFVYSDENEGIKCLYRYNTCILTITSRPVRTWFRILKPNYGGMGVKPPAARGNRGSGRGTYKFGNFCIFF